MSQSRSITSMIAAAITLLFASTSSFGQAPPPLTVPPAQTFPNEDIALTSQHLNRARHLFAGLKDPGSVAQVDETRARVLLAEGQDEGGGAGRPRRREDAL